MENSGTNAFDDLTPPRMNLFSVNKLNYARGDRPKVDCILCGVKDKDPIVDNLSIAETNLSVISINLYPYNPGHLIIFPKRHVLSIVDLTDEEALDIHRLTTKAIQILSKAWRAQGFNVGYNIGKNSGGSIPHIHEHIVPRFPNEAGFLDVFSNTRIVIYDPFQMKEEIQSLWNAESSESETK
jgi:ATP adenylyltransferase